MVLSTPSPVSGYSLIEVLVTLAITAIVSSLIFASLATQVRQIETVEEATGRILDNTARARMVEEIVSNTIPAWPEQTELQFRGTGTTLSGLSTHALLERTSRLQPYRLQLLQSGESATLSVATSEGEWLLTGFPAAASLRYLGPDGLWYGEWPPPERPAATLQEIEDSLRNKSLPAMVAIASDENASAVTLTLALENSGMPFVRTRDLADTDPAGR